MKLFSAAILTLAACLACQPSAKTAHSAPLAGRTGGGGEKTPDVPLPMDAMDALHDDASAPAEGEGGKDAKEPPVLVPDAAPKPAPAAPGNAGAPEAACVPTPDAAENLRMYPWPRKALAYESACLRFPVPAGARRVDAPAGSYAYWLRHLPVMPAQTPVHRYDGVELPWATQWAAAVVDINTGTEDLQQCMDAIMRLRAEYHWSRGRPQDVRFPYAGGVYFGFDDWRRGLRPRKAARGYELAPLAAASDGRKSFEKYLRFMFAMTGTAHYPNAPAVTFDKLEAGDFFLEPSPSLQVLGHALVVIDLARDASGRTWALVGQSYTPALDFHILRASPKSVWFELDPSAPVKFPSWSNPYGWNQVRRFKY